MNEKHRTHVDPWYDFTPRYMPETYTVQSDNLEFLSKVAPNWKPDMFKDLLCAIRGFYLTPMCIG